MFPLLSHFDTLSNMISGKIDSGRFICSVLAKKSDNLYVGVDLEGKCVFLNSQEELPLDSTLVIFRRRTPFLRIKKDFCEIEVKGPGVFTFQIPIGHVSRIVARLLDPDESLCWNPQCLSILPKKYYRECQSCFVAVYCNARCRRVDTNTGIHKSVCDSRTLECLRLHLKDSFRKFSYDYLDEICDLRESIQRENEFF